MKQPVIITTKKLEYAIKRTKDGKVSYIQSWNSIRFVALKSAATYQKYRIQQALNFIKNCGSKQVENCELQIVPVWVYWYELSNNRNLVLKTKKVNNVKKIKDKVCKQ